MDPSRIPFNALIVGPTNSAKSSFVVDQLYGPFRFKFDNIVLIFPTIAHNKTYHRIGENDPRMSVITCMQRQVENVVEDREIGFRVHKHSHNPR